MKRKAVYAYAGLLLLTVASFAFPHRAFTVLFPAYLIGAPLLLGRRIRLSLSAADLGLGLLVSAVVLIPFSIVFTDHRLLGAITVRLIATQLFWVALPEEAFFRGFLQEVFGNNVKGVVVVSLLFAAAHLPAVVFRGETTALLTFFPSLVMGLLYMKTSNILPPTVFHLLSNVVFSAFVI